MLVSGPLSSASLAVMSCAGPLCYTGEGGNVPCCLGLMLTEWRVGRWGQSMAKGPTSGGWPLGSALFPKDGVVKPHP